MVDQKRDDWTPPQTREWVDTTTFYNNVPVEFMAKDVCTVLVAQITSLQLTEY